MARIRSIKPEFPQSESMGNVSRDARLTFLQLWTIADDEGRLRGNSRMLASLLFPYDDDAPGLIDGWLAELERENCILRYRVSGQNYLQIANWLIHQKIDKPSKSKIPPFSDEYQILANPRECSSEDQGSRIKDQGRDQGEDQTPAEQKALGVVVAPRASHDTEIVADIFGYWKKVMLSPGSVLDDKRKRLIRDALKLGYSAGDICKAIRGCSKSPYHMGQNDKRTQYNGLNLILRSAEYIDKFIKLDSGNAALANETDEQRTARITAEFLGETVDDENTIEMEA